jgi:hypothetical protein
MAKEDALPALIAALKTFRNRVQAYRRVKPGRRGSPPHRTRLKKHAMAVEVAANGWIAVNSKKIDDPLSNAGAIFAKLLPILMKAQENAIAFAEYRMNIPGLPETTQLREGPRESRAISVKYV